MTQRNFLCLDEKCDGILELIATGPNIDGDACGNGYRENYYQCTECDQFYQRTDFDSIGPFSYEKLQKDIRKIDRPPSI